VCWLHAPHARPGDTCVRLGALPVFTRPPAPALFFPLPDARPDVRGAQSASGSEGACAACVNAALLSALRRPHRDACAVRRATAHTLRVVRRK
jgi:hypothetical protein